MTMRSKTRKEKNRAMAAERMIQQARDAECTAASRNLARAAAQFGDGGTAASKAVKFAAASSSLDSTPL